MRVALAAFLAMLAGEAHAERLALIGSDAELERATRAALAPWKVEVVSVAAESPGATMPQAADRAQAMAEAQDARAVVWTATTTEPVLWVYDAATRRAVSLRLAAAPPFDQTTAAAVALTIKTLLSYGEPARPAASIPPPPPAPPPPPPAPPADEWLAVELRVGASVRPAPAPSWEPRVGLAALVRPRRDRPWLLAVGVRLGSGLAIDHADVSGEYHDAQVAAGARVLLEVTRRLRLIPALAATLHVVDLQATSATRMESAQATFLDPGLDAALHVEVAVAPRVRLGAVLEGSTILRRQRFLAGGEEVFDVPRMAGDVGLALIVALD